MSTSKEAVSEHDLKHEVAIQIALEVGLLERCPIHGCVYDAMNDFAMEDAIRCGESLMMQNESSVAVFQNSRRRLRYAIENIRSGMPNGCPDCYYGQFQNGDS